MLPAFGFTDTQRFPVSETFTLKRQSDLKICAANKGAKPAVLTLLNMFKLLKKVTVLLFINLKFQRYKQILNLI